MHSNLLVYLLYLMIGLGIGYLLSLGATGGPTSLDYKKQELESKKEWYRMLASKKNGQKEN